MTLAQRTTHEWTLWVVAVSCAAHATEEYFTGWQEWARQALGIAMPTDVFVAMNVILTIAAFAFARTGWRRPAISLIVPTATLVNAIAFHITPTIVARQIAPGLYTAILLYLPFSSWALVGAVRDGVRRTAIIAGAVTGIVMAFGVVLAARQLGR
jgi:hypothetical protein